jgi:cytochrome c peroxidase
MRGLWSVVALAFLVMPLGSFAQTLPTADAVFQSHDMRQVQLGQLLFYDPILSGNKSVSCATCHHPRFATTDGLALGLGDGATGLGLSRKPQSDNYPEQRIPRNSPALFNLGAKEFQTLFHDGRLQADINAPLGFRTPLGADMEAGFDGVLSAQTMFPVLSPDEMAGHYSENEIAQAVRQGFFTGPKGAWALLSKRVAAIPDYQARFAEILPKDKPLHFSDISNAIAAFMAFEWRADDSPFDRYLRTNAALPQQASHGMALFYGKAGCSACHSGQFQTDHQFHAIAMPQIGPGKAGRFEQHARDEGRLRVTGDPADAYRFRTPSLRNVTHTGPYGHAGSYATLRSVVLHHLAPVFSLESFDPDQVVLPILKNVADFTVMQNTKERDKIAFANALASVKLSAAEIDQILAFLGTLTDKASIAGRLGIPTSVPSGLAVDQ